jgi:anaerobic magnesium-protoporphyrin IX monomethyl ester cyclase
LIYKSCINFGITIPIRLEVTQTFITSIFIPIYIVASQKGRVLLIGAEDEENLALRYLAAVLVKDGHKVVICPCSDRHQFKDALKQISKFKPHLIGISFAFQQLAPLYFQLVRRIRESGYTNHITVGGHFATFEFQDILRTQPGIDTVIRFEGEAPISRLISTLLDKSDLSQVPNLVYRDGYKIKETDCILRFTNLDDLPYPIRTERPQTRIGENFSTLVSSRGCWHASCLYCCIGAFHSKKIGEKYTFRSPENVAKEISRLYHDKGVTLFQFHDDNFMMPTPPESVERFRRLREALVVSAVKLDKIGFIIKARPDSITDEVSEELSKLGVVGTFLGVENASETGVKALIRGNSLKSINDAIASLEKFGIAVSFNLLIFHPTARMEEISENISFLEEHSNLPFDVARAEIVAGSPLERLVISKKTRIGTWPTWGYILDDPAVDRMFEIYLRSYRRKGSLCQALAQDSIMLAYHAYVLKRLHHGRVASQLSHKAINLLVEYNRFMTGQLDKMRKMARDNAGEQSIEAYFWDLNQGCRLLIRKIENISGRMSKLQFVDRQFDRFGIRDIVQENRFLIGLFGI